MVLQINRGKLQEIIETAAYNREFHSRRGRVNCNKLARDIFKEQPSLLENFCKTFEEGGYNNQCEAYRSIHFELAKRIRNMKVNNSSTKANVYLTGSLLKYANACLEECS